MRDRIAALPMFTGLPDSALSRLAEESGELEAPAGSTLVERGQPGSGLFVLQEGTAVVETPNGEAELGPGDTFGELALLGIAERRTARVRARTDVRCLTIGRIELERLLSDEPELGRRLRELAAERLREREGGAAS
jgi:CRP-like cAMP-binding protein